MTKIIERVWSNAEDLIGVAEDLETMILSERRQNDAEKLRDIVGELENWCKSVK